MSADHPAPASPANDAEPVVITVDAADPRYGFGVDVGGSGVKGGIVDLKTGELVGDRFKITTPQPATPDAVAATVAQIVDHFGWTGRVGITLPSVVAGRIVRSAANIDKAWIGIDPYELFGRHLSSPALSVLNDADAAGLAEVEYGTNDDAVDGVIIMLTLGTGIGSAVLLPGGQLLPNTELGHLQVDGDYRESWQPHPMSPRALEAGRRIAETITDLDVEHVNLAITRDQGAVWIDNCTRVVHANSIGRRFGQTSRDDPHAMFFRVCL